MRIKELHLENFRGFEKLDIEFPANSNVTVFIGENGSGKSSLLDAIAKALSIGIKTQFHVRALINDLSYSNIKESEINNKTNEKPIIIVTFKNGLEKNLFDKVEISDTSHSISNILGQRNKLILNLFSYYNLHSDLEILFADSISYEANLSEYKGIATLGREQSKEIISIYQNALKINLTDKNITLNVFEEWFLSLENKELQTIFDKKNFNFRLQELEIFRHTIKTFYNNLNDVKFDNLKGNREKGAKMFDNTTQWIELTKDNETLRLNQLSSGEINLLMLISDITRRLLSIFELNSLYSLQEEIVTTEKIQQSEGIVLIDEIELHLHPKWQRNIVPALTKTFPNIQFIITTHSPQVLSYVPNGSAFSIENGNAYPVHTYGRDNEWILETIMNDIARPKEIQEKIDQLFDLIRENKIDEAKQLRREIASIIGEDEGELLKADILIQRKNRALSHEAH